MSHELNRSSLFATEEASEIDREDHDLNNIAHNLKRPLLREVEFSEKIVKDLDPEIVEDENPAQKSPKNLKRRVPLSLQNSNRVIDRDGQFQQSRGRWQIHASHVDCKRRIPPRARRCWDDWYVQNNNMFLKFSIIKATN
mmetsp:Transcript_19161/g.26974  ORF Transcript_19161/g.26974 Transcript_19161/m.26974 type:complete len:140 (+) Transcript_19161:176-595(+)